MILKKQSLPTPPKRQKNCAGNRVPQDSLMFLLLPMIMKEIDTSIIQKQDITM